MAWRGWEFYDPKTDCGFIQLFRPANAAETHRAVRLKGLDPAATYELWNRETDEKTVIPAATLLTVGFAVELASETAVTFTFQKRD